MAGNDIVGKLEASGVVAVVRLDDLSDAVNVSRALAAGGVRGIEFTFTNPKAGAAITAARDAMGDDAFIGRRQRLGLRDRPDGDSRRSPVRRDAHHAGRDHSDVYPLRYPDHVRGIHADRDPYRLGGGFGDGQSLSGDRARTGVPQETSAVLCRRSS